MQLVKQKLQSYGWLKAKAQLIVKTQYIYTIYYIIIYYTSHYNLIFFFGSLMSDDKVMTDEENAIPA